MTTTKNGVEYEHFPPPSALMRADHHAHAIDLVTSGTVYMSNAGVYREAMDPGRGDVTETDGRFIRQGIPCRTGHTNPIFLWCTTMESDPSALLETWEDRDTIIRIHDPQLLAERMLKTAVAQGVRVLSFHAGRTRYDKCRGSEAPYHWSESIFQKPGCYSRQEEYRFALVADYCMSEERNIILKMGSCKGLVTIAARRGRAVSDGEDGAASDAEEEGG